MIEEAGLTVIQIEHVNLHDLSGERIFAKDTDPWRVCRPCRDRLRCETCIMVISVISRKQVCSGSMGTT